MCNQIFNEQRRFWNEEFETKEAKGNLGDEKEGLEQERMEVKTFSALSHNVLTSVEEYVQWKGSA